MRVVVTGSRAHADEQLVRDTLDDFHRKHGIDELAHGNAGGIAPLSGRLLGADRQAAQWCEDNGIPATPFPVSQAEWRAKGRAAGPVRNRFMLDQFKPDVVIAFPGGPGTHDCVTAAKDRGIEVVKINMRPRVIPVIRQPREEPE